MLAFLEGPELIVVLVVLALVVGANRLPKLARQLGQAQQELKKGLAEGAGDDDAPAPTPAQTATATDRPDVIEATVTEVTKVTKVTPLPAPAAPIPPPAVVQTPAMPPPLRPPGS